MKKKLLTGIAAALALSLSVASCGDESSSLNSSTGTGHIKPLVQIDGNIITATGAPESRANDDVHVTVTDLKLKLTSDDGSFSQEWKSVNEFDEKQEFKVGIYTLEAYYGDENDAEGFAKPHFHGEQTITVKFDNTTEVELSAEMKNSRVKVRYTDAFRQYMSSYSVQLKTAKNNFITIASDEVNPVYVTPGEVTLNLNFETSDGKQSAIQVAQFEAKAKTEHVVTLDLAGGDAGADAILKVNFDDTVAMETIEINLNEDITEFPKPEITPEGWESGDSFSHIEFSKAPGQIKANITAAGNIGSVMLYTTSPSLIPEGWPTEIDLTKANSAQQSQLTQLGLKARGVWNKPEKMAVVDFTDVFTHLGIGLGQEESTHSFKLQVKDTHGQLSDEMEFTVITTPGQIEIIWATAEIGRKNITAEVVYNGTDNLADVKFQKRAGSGAGGWDDLAISEVTPVAGKDNTYTVKMTSPTAIEISRKLMASFGSASSSIDFDVTTPPFELIAAPEDVFAKRAIITVKCEDADDALVAKNLSFTLNGKNWDNYKVNGADIELTRLTKKTKYDIVAESTNHKANASITTEDEQHIDEWYEGDDGVSGFPTSSWAAEQKGDYQYLWSTTGWATLNELTTSTSGSGHGSAGRTGGCSYKATSGTIPANGRSTFSFTASNWSGTTSHADGHTEGKSAIHNDRHYNGTNAALIRTVGWGSGNKAHEGTFSGLDDDKGFDKCDNMTQGELYLGAYDNGPQYGIDFKSRPSGLTFAYRYDVVTAGNNDFGTAELIVYSGDQIIAYGYKELTERSSYTEETISVSYAKGSPKATKVAIIFRSTTPKDVYKEKHNGQDNPALTQDKTFWHTPGANCTSGGEYVGSELYIDDVSLTY